MKNIFKRKKNNLDKTTDNTFDSSLVNVYFFSLYHKPSKRYILLISDPYPSRDIAEWSAGNYFRWLLNDKYKEEDVIICIHNGIPEIIDNSINNRQESNSLTD